MKTNRISVFAFFLFTQFIVSIQVLPQDINSFLPETNLNINESKLAFRYKYDMMCLAMKIYKLDALERNSPAALKEMLAETRCGNFLKASGLVFDFDKLNVGKKGWTRYYPFYVNGQSYVIRIFRTEESYYQPDMKVLFEAKMESPNVTFQILPGLNELLRSCEIKPHPSFKLPESSVCP